MGGKEARRARLEGRRGTKSAHRMRGGQVEWASCRRALHTALHDDAAAVSHPNSGGSEQRALPRRPSASRATYHCAEECGAPRPPRTRPIITAAPRLISFYGHHHSVLPTPDTS
uniref:Uncharacterized protein n=1 Tax=Plectus sambesii TaxID=2011161 RepID=A0A914WM64_9BILA